MMAEPKFICRYALLPIDVVLADVATLLKATAATDSLRIITEAPATLDALRAWCVSAGVTIIREDESRVATRDGCITEYSLDLQSRLPRHPRV